jgi:hypothetical protein
VIIAFLFFPETWAVVSHLSHPGSGRLLGYRVSIPANWVVLIDEPDIGGSHTWSSVAAINSKGVLTSGRDCILAAGTAYSKHVVLFSPAR